MESQDKRAKRLKRSLEAWREVALAAHAALACEKRWHPAATFGAVSCAFALAWALEPPPLSVACALLCAAACLDALAPALGEALLAPPAAWTKAKERRLEELCAAAVEHADRARRAWRAFCAMRETSAKTYYAILITSLSIATWVSARTNNLLLLYLTTLIAIALPGLYANEKLHPMFAKVIQKIDGITEAKKTN